MQVNKDLWRALKEIMPTDDFEVRKVKRKGDIYEVDAEDKDHHYRLEILLTPHAEDHHYRLLDFSYEEKRRTQKR